MNIVLGVSGGIAAYKAVSLARLIVEAGHELHVVPTADALRFVGLPTWEAISRNPVTVSVHDDVPEVRHVALGQRADLVVVAPATANTIARMVAGLADDLLGTTLLATRAPVLVAPAMHTEMWEHASTQHNMQVLRARGVHVVGPESGRLTGNDSGQGRLSEPDTIFAAAMALLNGDGARTGNGPDDEGRGVVDGVDGISDHEFVNSSNQPGSETRPDERISEADSAIPTPPAIAQDFASLRVLVSAGGTREPIDPVRYLGNRSSGRQGVAVARAAADRGAAVVLLAANIDGSVLADLGTDSPVRVVSVGSAAELEDAAHRAAPGADIIVMAAAVADYRVAEVASGKLRKEDSAGEPPSLTLIENPDILVGLVESSRPGQTIVGFAAETVDSDDELLERGRRKLARKGVNLLAVNAVGWDQGFESQSNELFVLASDGSLLSRTEGTKREVSDALLDGVLACRAENVIL